MLFNNDLLHSRNFTAHSLARKTGLTPATVYRYRDGHLVPSLQNARMIATVLDVFLDDLMFAKENTTPSSE